jgi:predicted flap endonuclease-1-like 5' DNA nuclease
MPYTLAKGLGWILLAVVLGILIGWLLRSVSARRQIARARTRAGESTEVVQLRERLAILESAAAGRDAVAAEPEPQPDQPPRFAATTEQAAAALDLTGAAAIVGAKVRLDDLKLVEGIGPKIEDLCHGIGIRSWAELSITEVSLLRTMLADAGPRFKTHDPSTWPEQARLLAAGRWAEFKALTERLHGGRIVG